MHRILWLNDSAFITGWIELGESQALTKLGTLGLN